MSYLGAKGGSGVYQKIINVMPPHDTYIEAFLGTGRIYREKAPAVRNILIDKSKSIIDKYGCASAENVVGCGVEYLKGFKSTDRTVAYLDPPYVPSTRTSNARYDHEMTEGEHIALCEAIKPLNDIHIILSGYDNQIYNELLDGWWVTEFQAMTRGGVRTEKLWCNFIPSKQHFHKFAGDTAQERQRIKRKAQRWKCNFEQMKPAERQAVMAALLDVN